MDHTNFLTSSKEGFWQKNHWNLWDVDQIDAYISAICISMLMKEHNNIHTEQQYVYNTLIYIHSVKQKSDLNSKMATTLLTDRKFGILTEMLSNILFTNTDDQYICADQMGPLLKYPFRWIFKVFSIQNGQNIWTSIHW